jgi:hypothetical protein
MIDARQAAKVAAQYYEEISGERAKLSIEEVEIDDSGDFWLITLGISDIYGIGSVGNKVREYKIFKIDAETGEVKSMKIRKV